MNDLKTFRYLSVAVMMLVVVVNFDFLPFIEKITSGVKNLKLIKS